MLRWIIFSLDQIFVMKTSFFLMLFLTCDFCLFFPNSILCIRYKPFQAKHEVLLAGFLWLKLEKNVNPRLGSIDFDHPIDHLDWLRSGSIDSTNHFDWFNQSLWLIQPILSFDPTNHFDWFWSPRKMYCDWYGQPVILSWMDRKDQVAA